jgi:hypothetical protein
MFSVAFLFFGIAQKKVKGMSGAVDQDLSETIICRILKTQSSLVFNRQKLKKWGK